MRLLYLPDIRVWYLLHSDTTKLSLVVAVVLACGVILLNAVLCLVDIVHRSGHGLCFFWPHVGL
jgi:hypothetical protein